MISVADRRQAVELISAAVDAGAALYKACAELGIHKRTYNRWKDTDSDYIDKRTICEHPEPANKLSQEEKQQILDFGYHLSERTDQRSTLLFISI